MGKNAKHLDFYRFLFIDWNSALERYARENMSLRYSFCDPTTQLGVSASPAGGDWFWVQVLGSHQISLSLPVIRRLWDIRISFLRVKRAAYVSTLCIGYDKIYRRACFAVQMHLRNVISKLWVLNPLSILTCNNFFTRILTNENLLRIINISTVIQKQTSRIFSVKILVIRFKFDDFVKFLI